MKKFIFVSYSFFSLSSFLFSQPNSLIIKKNKDSHLKITAIEILKIFREKQYYKLDKYIDPKTGIRFSPYAHVNLETDRVLFAKDFKKLGNKILFWGYYDNSEDSIKLSLSHYMEQFVYGHDFLLFNQIKVNNYFVDNDPSNNMKEVYKNCEYVEFHYPGGREPDNMDWKSLRLVFKERGDSYILIAVLCEILLR